MWNFLTLTLVGLNLVDYALTSALIRYAGTAAESNPVARWVVESHGPAGMLALKLTAVGVAVAVVRVIKSRRPVTAWCLQVGLCGLMLAVVGYSAWLLHYCAQHLPT